MWRRVFVGILMLSSLLAVGNLLMPRLASAASSANCTRNAGGFLNFPTWYKYLSPEFGDSDGDGVSECQLDFSFTEPADFAAVALAIFEIVMRIGGIFAVIFIVYGGIQYVISTGEPDKVAGARTTIINAVVGMMIAIFASAAVNLIGRTL